MRFEEVSDAGFTCIITDKELESRNITVDDMMSGSDIAKELVAEVCAEAAESNLGFYFTSDDHLSVQVGPTEDDEMCIIVEKNPEIPDMAENPGGFSEEYACDSKEQALKEVASALIQASNMLAAVLEAKSPENPQEEAETVPEIEDEPEGVYFSIMLECNSMSDVLRSIRAIWRMMDINRKAGKLAESALFKYDDKYYLELATDHSCISGSVTEFGEIIWLPMEIESIKEHGDAIIKENALEKLMDVVG